MGVSVCMCVLYCLFILGQFFQKQFFFWGGEREEIAAGLLQGGCPLPSDVQNTKWKSTQSTNYKQKNHKLIQPLIDPSDS